MFEKRRVLITCKTYPLPSPKYRETVCTGGVLPDGSFIRLYPIDFRYRPYWQWFKKYQWIEVEIERHSRDKRPESYRPRVESIRMLGEPLGREKAWQKRRQIVLKRGVSVMCNLEHISREECSLGIIRPNKVLGVKYSASDATWSPKQEAAMKQSNLFGPSNKPLEKIPYSFHIKFNCGHPDCRTHTKSIEDWEVGVLFRKMRDQTGDPEAAAKVVCSKLQQLVMGANKDTHLFVGTESRHQSWLIVGTF